MIRKTVLIMLASLTLGTGSLSLASFVWSFRFEPIDSSTAWLRVGFNDGRCTAYYLTYNYDGQHPYLQRTLRPGATLQYGMLRNNVSPKNLRTLTGRFQYVAPPPGQLSRVQYVAFPLWASVSILGAYPTTAFIRGRFRLWHRRRKGLCIKCGYDLTGNVTGVCSECGEEVR